MAGPGRPKKINETGTIMADENDMPRVKQIIRYLSKQGRYGQEGSWPVGDVDVYLSEFINLGYTLFDTHYMGEAPEGYGVLYVLVR
jgi:hypothetical protein